MAYDQVLYSFHGGRAAHISLNDPERRNTISQEIGGEIVDALGRAGVESGRS